MATIRTLQKQQTEALILSALILCSYNMLCAAQVEIRFEDTRVATVSEDGMLIRNVCRDPSSPTSNAVTFTLTATPAATSDLLLPTIDYVIPANIICTDLEIRSVDDTVREDTEAFLIVLIGSSTADVIANQNQFILYIQDNDPSTGSSVFCPSPTPAINGIFLSCNMTSGGICTYQCNVGYGRESGLESRTCDQDTLTWTETPLVCTLGLSQCASSTCQNGGFCISLPIGAGYKCSCYSGWTGIVCTQPTCSPNPCGNRGFCSIQDNIIFMCSCLPGWIGIYCTQPTCTPNPCQNGGFCNTQRNDGSICSCPPVWTGTYCRQPICIPDPCQNGGFCSIQDNIIFMCICLPGWTGIYCTQATCTPNLCQNGGVCSTQRNDGSICSCPPGWTGIYCTQVTCSPDPCQNAGFCTTQRNSGVICNCLPGWIGTYCTQPTCTLNPCANGGSCFLQGSFDFVCTCTSGWSGSRCTQPQCTSNPCLNGGSCFPFGSSVHCKCATGWTGTFCNIDVNECESQPCSNGGICIDHVNGFICNCQLGWSGSNCAIECTALTFGDPSCNDSSCWCTGNEVCKPVGSCSRSCSVFECPADIEGKTLAKVNPFLSVDIRCSLTASTTVLDRLTVRLSWNENNLDQNGITQLTDPNRNNDKEQTTYRVTNVTGEETLYCILVQRQNHTLIVIGGVRVTGFVSELPSLGTAPTLITKSNTSITIQWNAWDSQKDIGDPPVVHYLPYYRMGSSDAWIRGPMEVLSEATLEFRAENLENDTRYDFSVAAVREGENGEGPRSPLVTLKTFCNVPEITADVTALFTPSNEINISWLLPPGEVMCSTGVTKFTVYYKIEGSSDKRFEMAGTVDDDTSIRWFVIDGRSLQSENKYGFFVTFTTDQESFFSEKTEDSVLEVPLFSTGPAPLYLISLIIIPILLIAFVLVFFIVRYRRNTNFKDGKTTKADDGEDEDYVNAAIADDSEVYIPLEKQSKTVTSCTYEDLNNKLQSSQSIPPQYEVTIVPERQRPVAPHRIQTRNMKEINSGAYDDVGASSENRNFPDVPQLETSGDKDEDNSYDVPDRLQEYTGVYVNITNNNKLKQPEPIKVAEIQKFMNRTKEDVVKDILHQFMSLPSGGQYPWSAAVKFQNKPRNFFKTILPYDHSRVKLDTAGSDARSDYINANYIKNHQGKISFIAAQGPQEGTVDDFWKMVWQENVKTIVMVTDTSEENKPLCCTYWPNKVHMGEVYGDITVILMESTSYTTHTIRKLNLLKGNPKPEVHVVTQVQVHYWPYGSVPKETTSLMSIFKEVKRWQTEGGSSPLLVHCSNGVGATGTFIALYVLMDIMRKNKDISVFDFVAKMREDRVDMVQTRIQYLFLFEFLLTVLQSTDSEISCNQLRKLGHAAIKLKSKKEFKVLQESTVKQQQVENCIGYSPENQHKNRFTSIVPDDKFRPVLKSQGNSYGCNSYINAFHVADMGGREFIMTQTPLTSTLEDFWRLVYDYECTTIVMLNTINDSDETVVQYWPSGGSAHYGLMKVICTVTTKNDCFVHRQFEVAHRKVEEKSICVHHFAFCGWSGYQPDIPKLKQFITYTGNKGPGPVLVHCINGIGLSGVYIIVTTEIERLESRGAVDVCQSLQRLRKKCSFAMQSQEEYTLCYQILKDHLDNPEEYAVVY